MSEQLAPTPSGVVTTAVVYVIVYNTTLVKEADAPKTWDDLLNPRWDGKIGIWVRGEGQGSLAAIWGEDKVVDYVRKMNAAASRAAAEHVPAGAAGRGRRDPGRLGAQSHGPAAAPARRADQDRGRRAGADQHALQLRSGKGEEPERRRRCSRCGSRRRRAPRPTRMRPTAAIHSSPAPRPTRCCTATRSRSARRTRRRRRPTRSMRINKMIESRETE